MIRLEHVSDKYFESLKELKNDYVNNAEKRIQGSCELENYQNLNEWHEMIKSIEEGKNKNFVRTSYFLIVCEEEVVGNICFRHELNSELEEFGGQIAYSIKPSAREKGYGFCALSLLLDMIKEDVLIMCENNNIASNRIIIKNGGVLVEKVIKYGLSINKYIIKSRV